jgi:L-asparaginase/Glu-tRNA(Gln) amidotransferase subunit D
MEKAMPHTHKKKKKTIKHYTPIERDHCNIHRVIECLVYAITSNWMTKDEWIQIVKGVNKNVS